MRRILSVALGLILELMIVSGAAGQAVPPDAAIPAPTPARITVDLKAGAWLPRLDGNVTFGSNLSGNHIRLKEQFDLNDLEFTFNAEMTLRVDDRWHVRAGGFDFSTESSDEFVGTEVFGALTLNPGDRFRASLDMRSVSLEAGIDFYRPLPNPRRGGGGPTTVRVAAMAGVRYLEVDQDVELLAGGRDSASGDWLAVYGGLELHIRYEPENGLMVGRAFVLDVNGAVGSALEEGGLLVQLRAGVTLEVTENLGVLFGYRLLEVDFDDGDYSFDAGLQGLFLAATLRF